MLPVPHPAKGHLAVRRISNVEVATRYGCSPTFVGRVLNGWVRAPEPLRQTISELTGLPVAELFHDDRVAA